MSDRHEAGLENGSGFFYFPKAQLEAKDQNQTNTTPASGKIQIHPLCGHLQFEDEGNDEFG